ncbi:Type IV secretory pathway, VirB3-like protein [Fusobacterium necrogenes]|uniref:Type IV secretory pathway, VirB3-like protein n=1 Tax=Fusobacterium necrogenes TaxID=858 RepID=A0A377GQ76_9FUSO|nr:VirB3 family type IV secretion system protein [Fusobacterium necrogenes]STO26880.1 Type IV secretory pathway, VirB3-like protein [Fusobacterium necrogenes]
MKKTENLKVPTCQTLLKPQTIMGISREAFILNAALGLCFVVIFESVIMLLFSLILHFMIYFFTKKDPLVLTIFLKKYIKEKEYYHEG